MLKSAPSWQGGLYLILPKSFGRLEKNVTSRFGKVCKETVQSEMEQGY